ncbi:MAG: hypothetical protein ACRDBG_06655 [Waterburya sp.]
MINSNNFVYSKAAAARILGIKVYAIALFEVWYKVCFVVVRGQRTCPHVGRRQKNPHPSSLFSLSPRD